MFKCPFDGEYCSADYMGGDGLCDADTLPIWKYQKIECKKAKKKSLMPEPIDPYLAKAQEMCPKKEKVIELLCGNVQNIETIGFNECLALCLPIVADLLKRVDELEKGIKFYKHEYSEYDEVEKLRKRIAELEEALSKTHTLWSKDTKRIKELEEEVKKGMVMALRIDRYKQALEKAKETIFSIGGSEWPVYKIIEQSLEGKR